MDHEISIKVNIADVVFPLKIRAEDEENVRRAAKMVNEKMKAYKEALRTTDKINLLSAVALSFATDLMKFQGSDWIQDQGFTQSIQQINDGIEELLAHA